MRRTLEEIAQDATRMQGERNTWEDFVQGISMQDHGLVWDAANRQINDEADRLYAQVRDDVGAFFWFADARENVQPGEREQLQKAVEVVSHGSCDQAYVNIQLNWWIDEYEIEHRAIQVRGEIARCQDDLIYSYADGLIHGQTPEEYARYLLDIVYPSLLRVREERKHELELSVFQREQAEEKANALLLEHLDEQQTRDWEREHKFSLTAKSGHVYTIHRFGSQPVLRDDGHNYCIQSAMQDIPAPDVCLARKLLIEADEERFFEIANDLTEWHRIPDQRESTIIYGDGSAIRHTYENGMHTWEDVSCPRFVGEEEF